MLYVRDVPVNGDTAANKIESLALMATFLKYVGYECLLLYSYNSSWEL